MQQGIGLGLALAPMSTLALLMQHDIGRLFPGFERDLGAVFLGAILIMEIVGPFAVQYGLRLAGETLPDATGSFRAYRPPAAAPAPKG